MGLRVVGPEAQGGLELRHGVGFPAGLGSQGARVRLVRLGPCGLKAQRLLIMGQGIGDPPRQPQQEVGQVDMRLGKARL